MADSNVESNSEERDSTLPSSVPLEETEFPLTADAVTLPSFRLSPEQWATSKELSRLDPQLAGLYRLGLELLSRAGEPGGSYMIAHARRELSRGVMSSLAGTDVTLQDDTTVEIPDNEKNRGSISAILQLPPSHPLVTKWFQLHSTLVSSVHFRQAGPVSEDVRKAFLGLSELLFGIIGPYFATQAQLDAFLSIASPDETQVDQVRPMLARPVQRKYFFGNLAHPGWLEPLARAGQFANPPEMIDLGEGNWRLQPWPEGDYLVRMTAHEPKTVTEILLGVPKKLKNPVVWAAITRAAIELPPELAEQLTPHLDYALRSPLPNWFSRWVIPLVRKLAEARQEGAFRLASCLLWLNRQPDIEVQEMPSAHSISRRGSEWVLSRLESYTLEQFLKEAVPALESFNPDKTLTLLAKTLDRATWLVEKAEDAERDYVGVSTLWCRYLDRSESSDDVRAQLAIALTGVATRVASIGEDEATNVLELLKHHKHEIFQRIKIVVLTVAGRFAQGPLDEAITNYRMLDSSPSTREYAALLRAQFNNSSPRAQRIFSYTLERGPEPEVVNNVLTNREIEPTEESVREIVANWQRQRLRWFHDQIPDLLLPMAARLGIDSRKPAEEERALNEEGFYIGGLSVRHPTSVSEDELPEMTAESLISHIEAQHSEGTIGGEEPTGSGLEQALSRYTAEHPEAASEIANRLIKPTANPGYVNAILNGFTEAMESDRAVPWREALELAGFIVTRADDVEKETEDYNSTLSWHWAAGAAARLLQKGCAKDRIPEEQAAAVWRALDNAFNSAAMWNRGDID